MYGLAVLSRNNAEKYSDYKSQARTCYATINKQYKHENQYLLSLTGSRFCNLGMYLFNLSSYSGCSAIGLPLNVMV